MQEITSTNWVQITGLETGKKYQIQATILSATSREPIKVLFAQQQNEPTTNKEGLITDTLLATGNVNIFVKSFATPYLINCYEVL